MLDINSVSPTVAAAGTTQATATALSSMANIVTSGTGGVSLVIPPGPGLSIFIINRSGVTITVYPASGGTIDGLSTNAGFTVPYLSSVGLQSSSTTQWYTTTPISNVAGTANGAPGTISLGATGSRPAAGNLNNIFIDTTLNIVQRDNGSSWITISNNGGVGISAGTTSQSTGTVSFSNANGVSFGLNAGTLTASIGPNIFLSAGTTNAVNSGTVVFSNSNGVSFGFNGQTLTGSVSQTVQPVAFSGSNGSALFSTISFGNLNGLSLYTSNGSVVGSYSVPTQTAQTQSVIQAISAGSTSVTSGNVVFSNSNNISFGLNAGTLTGSVPPLTQLSGVNGISLSSSGNTISIGYTGQVAGEVISAGTNSQSSGTIVFSNSNGVSFGLNTNGVLTGSIGPNIVFSAGTTNAVNSGTIILSNSNGVSFGFNGQTLTGSHAVNISAGTTSTGASALTFSNSNNVNFGLNAGVITASAVIGSTAGIWEPPYDGPVSSQTGLGGGVVNMFPAEVEIIFSASRADLYANFSMSTSSNSSFAATISVALGFYTRNVSTLSLASSGSQSYTVSNTSNSSTAAYSGLRNLTLPIAALGYPGDYWIGVLYRTSTSNANWLTMGNMVFSNQVPNFAGLFGNSTTNTTQQQILGLGQYSTTTASLPSSVAFSQLIGTNATQMLVPMIAFHNVTA